MAITLGSAVVSNTLICLLWGDRSEPLAQLENWYEMQLREEKQQFVGTMKIIKSNFSLQ